MLDKRQNELKDLLKEGAAALVEMRKGIANACAELRTLYSQMSPRYGKSLEKESGWRGQKEQNGPKRRKEIGPFISY